MLTQFSSLCSICKVRIPAGADARYDPAAKTVSHWACHESQPPGPDAFRLADSLGFRRFTWEELISRTEQ